ncbi:hypothetical protein [Kitasatospora sp. A2-31]|uniref:hypothetical protein n=1 Tax=Kitasatospora sp. A2-31 TaxID=2916414 RepID=UPI001EECD9D8|nr:hypothetical protein [Kitasatospora sp. A2-31]MCG6495519.1 hypothetical protein [Kitasatospora sp. A2-31]
MGSADPLYRVSNPRFDALFMLGADDSVETVDNVDAELIHPDGRRWSATFMTLDEISRVMDRWRETGECFEGRYFHCDDLVIVRDPGVQVMVEVFERILDEGDPDDILQRIE